MSAAAPRQAFQESNSVEFGHVRIADDQIEGLAIDLIPRLLTIGGLLHHFETSQLMEHFSQSASHRTVIVDYQDTH